MIPNKHKNRDIRVDILSAGFGLGSWIAMTGLWVELPVLVQRLPEGWALPSQLSLMLQIANVGPVIYGFCRYRWPNVATERMATHLQLGIGTLSTLLLIFFWTWTYRGVSVALFVLSFGLSLVDCTSSVVFLPFMAVFRACYLTPYLVGEGLSGLLPSLVAIAQGIENPDCINKTVVEYSKELDSNVTRYEMVPIARDPRFSAEWFFAILLGMVLLSWIAFVLLDKLPFCQKEKVEFLDKELTACEMEELNKGTEDCQSSPAEDCIQIPIKSKLLYYYLLFLQLWASVATFGVFPAIQSYSCLPYGESPFHLAVTLCGVAYPVACLLAMFYEMRSVSWISWLSLASTMVSVYALVTAVMSPVPPLLHSPAGAPLIVLCWVSFMFAFSYIKTMATILLGDYWGHEALFWCGAVTQGGAAFGALLMFVLVNVFHLFSDEDMCVL